MLRYLARRSDTGRNARLLTISAKRRTRRASVSRIDSATVGWRWQRLRRSARRRKRTGRDSRGDVATAVEQWAFGEGGAGSLSMEHVVATSNRRLANLHGAFCHEKEPMARLAFLEEHLARPEAALRTLLREPSELGGG
jgi:hypothetical protein